MYISLWALFIYIDKRTPKFGGTTIRTQGNVGPLFCLFIVLLDIRNVLSTPLSSRDQMTIDIKHSHRH